MTNTRETSLRWVEQRLELMLPGEARSELEGRAEVLVTIAEQYRVPIEALIRWIDMKAPEKQWAGSEWRRFLRIVPADPRRSKRGRLMYRRSGTSADKEQDLARAAFYGLYLRQVCGYAPDEAAALVIDCYPRARPWLEQFLRYEASTQEESHELPERREHDYDGR